MQTALPGIDSFIEQAKDYRYLTFGLVTNNAALASSGEASGVALLQSGLAVKKFFSPEHGLNAKGEDGSFQKNFTDPVTGLPVISLYSDKLKPLAEDLKDIDAVLFDIPDAGCRFYTYLWTMTYVMEACAENNKQLIILDRPNPSGGNMQMAEGPMLDETSCSSFIGRWNIPIRHCCTLGELANYFLATRIKNIQLKVIKVKGWNRNESPGISAPGFVQPSPAITNAETVLLYPGMGLLEGININEGRGTAAPFKVFGAPWMDADLLLKEFNRLQPPGVKAEKTEYTPDASVYTHQTCFGLQMKVTDTAVFKPVLTGIEIIRLIQNLFPEHCGERLYKTVANPSGKNHLDRLTGILNSFEKIKSGAVWQEKFWDNEWERTISPFLLY